jgi:hypothetical protein
MRPERQTAQAPLTQPRPFAWLVELPPLSDRTVRMEALIAHLRLLLVAFNAFLLFFLLDTSQMHLRLAWWLIVGVLAYGLFVVGVRPYVRWRIFRTSILTTFIDSLTTAVFIGVTGGSTSPFFPIYFLVAVSVGMRFELRQALIACCIFNFTYAVAFFVTWNGTGDEFGQLALRSAYMTFAAIGVGYLAREEKSRSLEVEVIERLHAENAKLLHREGARRAHRQAYGAAQPRLPRKGCSEGDAEGALLGRLRERAVL